MSRVVLLGNGGREHAIAETIGADTLFTLPGNAGTELVAYGENVPINPTDIGRVAAFAREQRADLVVSGPEAPLAAGVGDAVRAKGLLFFGPNQAGARLEASKAYATSFMAKYGIPHPRTEIVHTQDEAQAAITRTFPSQSIDGVPSFVIKKDGLHAGKGVTVPNNTHEATEALMDALPGGRSGEPILLQEKLHGPEVSMFVLVDGTGNYQILPFSQDHKRVGEGDTGKNTGGMGAYAPVPERILSAAQVRQLDEIAAKTAYGLKAESNIDYRGVIYVGTILAEEYGDAPRVIEYNVRFGDPEAQVVLPLLKRDGASVYHLLRGAAEGKLDDDAMPRTGLEPKPYTLGSTALTICIAAPTYPDGSSKGLYVTGTDEAGLTSTVFYGGVIRQGDNLVTNGGRLLYTTGIGRSLETAHDHALRAAEQIRLVDPQSGESIMPRLRRDIGHQALTAATR